MGVKGLTTYINSNEDVFLKHHLLCNSELVIDGNSLVAQLYGSLNSFSAFGGDYDKYASYVKSFFQNLRKCNVTCYVLFDGSYEKRKLKTVYQRLRSKINGASRLDPVTQSSLKIYPLLLRDVFQNVLDKLQVPYTVCEFEADDEIAVMARHLNCPVLSYDSDFFIYNVIYIPFKTLTLKPTVMEVDGVKLVAFECKIYKVENLFERFSGLTKDILPLLATLLGNDYVEKKVFNNFFSQLKLSKSKKKTNEQQRSIQSLFKWFENESFNSALLKVLGRLKKSQKNKVFNIIKNSVEVYNRKTCKSLKYFGFDVQESNTLFMQSYINKELENLFSSDCTIDCEEESSTEKSDAGSSNSADFLCLSKDDKNEGTETSSDLPDWIVEGIRHSYIPRSYINLYTNYLYFCSPQAEDYTEEDAFLLAIPILRYAFDILTDFSCENFVYVSRDKIEYKHIYIDKEYAVSNPFDSNHSGTNIHKLPHYFRHFLKQKWPTLDLGTIELLPDNYQILMFSILWWGSNSKITTSYVYSLFLCYIMLDVIDEKTGMFRGHHFFHNKHSKKIQELQKRQFESSELSTLHFNKNKVFYEDCLLAAGQLLKFFELDVEIRKRPKCYEHHRIHKFAQFQCCLQQFTYLNALCRLPYKNCDVFNSFNGTFLYNLSFKLDQQDNPLYFVEHNLLKGAHSIILFFKSLCNIYDQCTKQLNLIIPNVAVKKRRKKKKKVKECNISEVDEFEVTL